MSLTARGRWAAEFFHRYWLPQLQGGTVARPTREAKRLIEGEE